MTSLFSRFKHIAASLLGPVVDESSLRQTFSEMSDNQLNALPPDQLTELGNRIRREEFERRKADRQTTGQ